ncbi:succinate dehydrogenase subunit 4, mitochondrial-like [Carex rostrata]
MASRLLAGGRSKILAQALNESLAGRFLHPSISSSSRAASSCCDRSLSDPRSKSFALDSHIKNNGHEQAFRLSALKPFYATSQVIIPRWFSSKPSIDSQTNKASDVTKEPEKVMAFSPLEATLPRKSLLSNESTKVKRYEQSIWLTYSLIPVLLATSKWNFTTGLAVLFTYHQVYGFFKEIILDYVHHEVTQKWVLIYLSLLLIFLAKETLFLFNLV